MFKWWSMTKGTYSKYRTRQILRRMITQAFFSLIEWCVVFLFKRTAQRDDIPKSHATLFLETSCFSCLWNKALCHNASVMIWAILKENSKICFDPFSTIFQAASIEIVMIHYHQVLNWTANTSENAHNHFIENTEETGLKLALWICCCQIIFVLSLFVLILIKFSAN